MTCLFFFFISVMVSISRNSKLIHMQPQSYPQQNPSCIHKTGSRDKDTSIARLGAVSFLDQNVFCILQTSLMVIEI